jgi:glycosyltransferase involved in cell wall biosynthesis
MKILMLAQSSNPIPSPKDKIFAPGVVFSEIADGLKARGHKVAVLASSDSKISADLIDFGIPSTHSIKLKASKDVWYRYYQHQMFLASEAVKEFKKGGYDLLHIDEFRVAPYFSEFFDGPITCTYHGIPAEDHDLRFDLDKMRQNRFFNRIKFIAATDKQRELGSEYFNFIATVHHGVDLNKFKYSNEGGDNLAFVGRLIEGKNPDIAIEVAEKSGCKVDLFGDYDEKGEYYLNKIKPKISEKVNVEGHIEYTKMPEVYQNSKALLFPITWDEAFGMVVIEAMACGTPVIAFDRGAMRELIADGVTGFVVKEGDVEGMVNAIRQIGYIDRRKCREYVKKNYSLEKMVDGYEKIFGKLIL